MSRCLRVLETMVVAMLMAAGAADARVPADPSTQMLAAPLRFEPNRGQTAPVVRFIARGAGYGLFLTDDEVVLDLGADLASADASARPIASAAILRLSLAGAQPARPHARGRQAGRSNYLSLDGRRRDLRDLPHFAELIYRQRYPGVDVVYYGSDGRLEYDFVVAPGADPTPIALAIDGADRVWLAANGDLNLEIAGRTLVQQAPRAFQYAVSGTDATRLRHTDATRTPVAAHYRIDAQGQVRIALDDYDRARALVIDPVFVYSSFLGGSGNDSIRDIARGSDGSLYLTGSTDSLDFPTANPIHGNLGGREAFITKLDPTGSTLVFSTYIGGLGTQQGNAIEVDPQARPIICGSTEPPGSQTNAFVLRLNANGTLSYARTIATANADECLDLALDGEQAVAVGFTFSYGDFPRVNPIATWNSVAGDAPFLVRYDSAGTLVQSTLLPNHPNSNDSATGVAVKDGFAYVTGFWSPDGDQANRQAFVIKLDSDATFPGSGEYLRSFGGNVGDGGGYGAFDGGRAITVDASGRAFVAGTTYATNFPVSPDAFQASYGGGGDAFIARLGPAGNVIFASYLHWTGASGFSEAPSRIAFDAVNTLYVVGDLSGAFIARLPNFATQLDYIAPIRAFYLDAGAATGVVMAGVGSPIVVGGEAGERFPVTAGAAQSTWGGVTDGYIMRLEERLPVISIAGAAASVPESAGCVSLTVSLDAAATADVRFNWSAQNGSAVSGQDYFASGGTDIGLEAGSASVALNVCISNDTLDEPDETFTVTLSGVTGATLGTTLATVTISDDDAPPVLSIDNGGCTVTEGNSGSTPCNFIARLSAASGRSITFNTATANGSASGGSDYSGHAATARTIAAGQLTTTIAVPVSGDTLIEPDESFSLNVSGVLNATPASFSATGVIVDDDNNAGVVQFSQSALSVNESANSVAVTVTRTQGTLGGATVSYATSNGSAAAPADYTALAGNLSFAAGETSKTLNLTIANDALNEGNETFSLSLSNAGGGTTLGTPLTVVITLVDDDPNPTIAVDNGGCSVTEGNSGSTNCAFVLRLSAVSGRAVSFTTATANATANAGSDYTAHSAITRSLAAGLQTLTVLVPVLGDTAVEANESFSLSVTGVSNATPTSLSATGTIVDDDTPAATGTLRMQQSQIQVSEIAGSVQLTVERAGGSVGAASVSWASSNGSAQAGLDYGAGSGTLSWAAGDASSRPITLTVINDPAIEPAENFYVTLSQASGASLGTPAVSEIVIQDGTNLLYASGFE